MAACAHVAIDFKIYIDRCYTLHDYHQTYVPQFQPIPHEEYWPQQNEHGIIIPDANRLRQKGRPRSTRIRNDMDIREAGNKRKCTICKEEGHDRQSCPRLLQAD